MSHTLWILLENEEAQYPENYHSRNENAKMDKWYTVKYRIKNESSCGKLEVEAIEDKMR